MLTGKQIAVVFCVLVSALAVSARGQVAGPPPRDVAPHKTTATATVLSLRTADNPGAIGADLGEDIVGKVTFTILKLRIHTFQALSSEGTPITDNAVIEAVTRDSVERDLVGKQVEVEMEERGKINRHRWLMTKINPTSSPGPK